ncbi:MAG: ribosome recycling factor [Endomicrobiales bacterium]|nr:ribosome recycling factor [Endomicrobiales bacterium]
MFLQELLKNGEESMKKTLEKLKAEFSLLRTGRASTGLIDNIRVESYGSLLPINQLAGTSVPDARTIEIRPWDISQLQAIEKAIQKSDIGLTPLNDGKVIRLSLPSLTEDRRKEMIKLASKIAEEHKVSLRNERRELIDEIKKAEKDKKLTEDERKKAEVQLQHLTDFHVGKIDEMLSVKEKDIIEI